MTEVIPEDEYLREYIEYVRKVRKEIDRETVLDKELRQLLYDRIITPYYYWLQEVKGVKREVAEEPATERQRVFILGYITDKELIDKVKALTKREASKLISDIIEMQKSRIPESSIIKDVEYKLRTGSVEV